MRKKVVGSLCVILGAGLVAAQVAQRVVVRGADGMIVLAQRSSQFYQRNHKLDVAVGGGGAKTALTSLSSGQVDIAQVVGSVAAGDSLRLPVGIEAVVVYVHPSNPVADLSPDVLKRIYTGKITNWKDVGGKNAPIQLYSTESPVGGSLFFNEVVLGGEEADTTMRGYSSPKETAQAVMQDPKGIGFGDPYTAKGVKLLNLRHGAQSVTPTTDNLRSGSFPLSRRIYWHLSARASVAVKQFAAWMLSSEGQLVVESLGYFPLNAADRQEAGAKLNGGH